MRILYTLAASAVLGLGLAGAARANDPVVPQTSSEQPITVPGALPGADVYHPNVPHLTAPSGITPRSAEGNMTLPNALPGTRAQVGESQPHSDVTGDTRAVPNASEGVVVVRPAR